MRIRLFTPLMSLVCAVGVAAGAARAAVNFGQVDPFTDGTTQGWEEGSVSPNPPTNEPTGGPGGAGDRFLRNASSGGALAGSRQVTYNRAQWAGNYNAAGVTRISMNLANFGPTTLYMRVAVESAQIANAWWASTTAVQLPSGSGWQTVHFDLTPAAMTDLTNGLLSLSAVLDNVATLRVLSARVNPAFIGDSTVSVVGMDNIRAIPEPATLGLIALPFLAARRRRSIG